MGKQEQNLKIQWNWLLFFLFLLFIYREDMDKLKLREINLIDLDKKSRLLNKIREYMDPQEQHIVHSAEIILQIIAKIKTLIDLPQIEGTEVRYSELDLRDRKRNMLMDLSKFFGDEKKQLIHRAVDFDVRAQALEKEPGGLHELPQRKGSISDIDNYIGTFESIFADRAKENAVEFEKLTSILKIINVLKSKEKINESDIIEIIYPFIEEGRKNSLMQIIRTHEGTGDVSDEKKESEQIKD